MKILVDRRWKNTSYTIDNVYIDGVKFSEGIEDKDRGLSDNMPEADILKKKVYGQTAIPTGTYDLELTYSPKFAKRVWGKKYGGKVPEIKKVKGFSGVRIHPLNTAADSLGCLGLGRNTQKGMVTQATKYYYDFMDKYIVPAVKRNEKITITFR